MWVVLVVGTKATKKFLHMFAIGNLSGMFWCCMGYIPKNKRQNNVNLTLY